MAEQNNLQTDMQNYINSMFDNNDDEDDTNAAFGIPSINDSLNIKNPLDVKPLATDNVFDYAIDKSQQLVGKGIQSFGDITGSETLQDFGESVATEQQRQIEEGGYTRPEAFSGGFTENLKAGNYGQAYGALNYSILESSPSLAVGAATSAAAAVGSVPVTLSSILLGTSYLATSGLGEMREEKEGQGVDATGNLTDLASAVAYGLVEFVGGKGGKTFVQIAKDAGQEAVQEGIIVGNTAIQGGEYVPEELVERFLDAAAAGGTTRAAIEGVTQSASFINERLTPAPSLTGEVLDSPPDVSTNQQEIPQLETPIIDLQPDVPSLTEPVPKITRTKALPNFNFDNKPAQLSVTKSLPAPVDIFDEIQEADIKATTREEEIGRLLRVSQREMLKEATQDLDVTDISDMSFNNRLSAFIKIDKHYKRLNNSISIVNEIEEMNIIGNEVRLNTGSFSQTQAPPYIEKVKNIIQNTWHLKRNQTLSLNETFSVISMFDPQQILNLPKNKRNTAIKKLSPEQRKDYVDFAKFVSENDPNKKIYKMPINFLNKELQVFIRGNVLSEDTIGKPVRNLDFPLYYYDRFGDTSQEDTSTEYSTKNNEIGIQGDYGIRTYSPVAMLMDNLITENKFPDTKEGFIKEIKKLTLEQPDRPAIVTNAALRALNIDMIADQIYSPENLDYINSVVEEFNSSFVDADTNLRLKTIESKDTFYDYSTGKSKAVERLNTTTTPVDFDIDIRTVEKLASASTSQEKKAIYAKMLINMPLSKQLRDASKLGLDDAFDLTDITKTIVNVDLESGRVLSHSFSVGKAIVDVYAEGDSAPTPEQIVSGRVPVPKNMGMSFDRDIKILNLEKITNEDMDKAWEELTSKSVIDGEQVIFGNLSTKDVSRLLPKTNAIRKILTSNHPTGPKRTPMTRYRTQRPDTNFYQSLQTQVNTQDSGSGDIKMTSYIRKDVITPFLEMYEKGKLPNDVVIKIREKLLENEEKTLNRALEGKKPITDLEESNPLFKFDSDIFEDLRNMAMKYFGMPENVDATSRAIAVRIPASTPQLIAMGIRPQKKGNFSIRYSNREKGSQFIPPPLRDSSLTHGVGPDVIIHWRFAKDWANIPETFFGYMQTDSLPAVFGEKILDAPDRKAGSRYQIETDKSKSFPHLELGDGKTPVPIYIVHEGQTDLIYQLLHDLQYIYKEAERQDVSINISEDFIGPIDSETVIRTANTPRDISQAKLIKEILPKEDFIGPKDLNQMNEELVNSRQNMRKFQVETREKQDFDRRKELAVSNIKDAMKLSIPAMILDAVKNGVEAIVYPSDIAYMMVAGRAELTTRLPSYIENLIAFQYASISKKNYGRGTLDDENNPFLRTSKNQKPTDEEIEKDKKSREGKTDILDLLPKSKSAYEITDAGEKSWKKYGPFVNTLLTQTIEELLVSDLGNSLDVKYQYVPYNTSSYTSGLKNSMTPYQISKKSIEYMNDTIFDLLNVLRFESNNQLMHDDNYRKPEIAQALISDFNFGTENAKDKINDSTLNFIASLNQIFPRELAQNLNVRAKIMGKVSEAFSRQPSQTRFKQQELPIDRNREAKMINTLTQADRDISENVTPLFKMITDFMQILKVLPNLQPILPSGISQGEQVTAKKGDTDFFSKKYDYLAQAPAAAFFAALVAPDNTEAFIDKRIKHPIQFNNVTLDDIMDAFDVFIDPIQEIKEISEGRINKAKELSSPTNYDYYDFKKTKENIENLSIEELVPNIVTQFLREADKIYIFDDNLTDDVLEYDPQFPDEQRQPTIDEIKKNYPEEWETFTIQAKKGHLENTLSFNRREARNALDNLKNADKYLEEIYGVRNSALARYQELSRNFMLPPVYTKHKSLVITGIQSKLLPKLISEGRRADLKENLKKGQDERDFKSKFTDKQIIDALKLRMRKGGLV